MNIVIVGNGIAGITAARFIRKSSDHKIKVISAESDHFFSRTALMYIYMGHMTYEDTKPYEDWFWKRNRIELVRGFVQSVDTGAKTIRLADDRVFSYDKLVLATGSRPNKFGWPGQDLDGVQGLYSLQDLQQMETKTAGVKRATVIGGGLIGIEMVEMLHSRHIPVTFLVRENGYMDYLLPQEESEMIGDEIRAHDIDLRLGTELKEVLNDGNGRASGVVTSTGETVNSEFVGLTVGVHPTIDLATASGVEANRGILVDDYFQTSADDVYAVGDCAEFRNHSTGHRPIEQLWYTGRNHGKTVAKTLCGQPTRYNKGTFFNSAKFFTIEYQTYGEVKSQLPENEDSVLWQDAKSKKLIRINYLKDTREVTGFNLLGVRFRHDRCEYWIRSRTTVDTVMDNIDSVIFDPEFDHTAKRSLAQIVR